MKESDLIAELMDAVGHGVADGVLPWLRGLGVTDKVFNLAGGVGVAHVETTRDGFYHLLPWPEDRADADPQAGRVVVVGVWDQLQPFDPDGRRQGGLYDIVVWQPAHPDRWWRRTGAAEWLGGFAVWAATDGEPLRLAETPAKWLAALERVDVVGHLEGRAVYGNRPACLLDVKPEYRFRWQVEGVSSLICDDEEHAGRVHTLLRRRPPTPPLPRVHFVKGGTT